MNQVHISADLTKTLGKIKPMHSVNNGPASVRGMANDPYFTEAGFPFARNHDAAFYAGYGGAHTVDIIAIFPNFDADENDPASYDFHLTDEYCARIQKTGAKVFYRLGNKIEHESKKYGAIPPKDNAKWARICEHIIRHLNEGWADGHHMNIEYWEIWNEPDLMPQCWTGKPEEFYELYITAATHLKACFPHLHIGGPAVTSMGNMPWLQNFFQRLAKEETRVPLDFFSFHLYSANPTAFGDAARKARAVCDQFGYMETELILNEWNYVNNWDVSNSERFYTTVPSFKASAFCAASLIEAQHSPMDHFMYYDARCSCRWNGLFHHIHQRPLWAFYAFLGWNELYKMGTEIAVESDDPRVRAVGARSADGKRAAVLFSFYFDHDSIDGSGTEAETVEAVLSIAGLTGKTRVTYRILDYNRMLAPASAETFGGECGEHTMELPLYNTVLVEMELDA